MFPGIALQCWIFKSFMEFAISNRNFILIEEETLISTIQKVLRVLVELDVSNGLSKEIKV